VAVGHIGVVAWQVGPRKNRQMVRIGVGAVVRTEKEAVSETVRL
jgi:hypothetical protein